jgi:hypothetical protein
MDTNDLSQDELADLLRDAEPALVLGVRDEDWPAWYAGYILDRLRERQP